MQAIAMIIHEWVAQQIIESALMGMVPEYRIHDDDMILTAATCRRCSLMQIVKSGKLPSLFSPFISSCQS